MINIKQNISPEIKKVADLVVEADNYYQRKRFVQATYLYQEALTLEPGNIHALNGAGLIAMQSGMFSIAVEFFDAACTIDPDNVTVNKNLAFVYTKLSRFDEAIIHYIAILDVDGNNYDVYGELARLNMQSYRLDYALHFFKYAFELNPEDHRNFTGMVSIDVDAVTEEDIKTIECLLDKSDLALDNRCNFYFSLARLYHAKNKYDKAFANILVANISKYAEFDSVKHDEYVSSLISTFTPDLFSKIPVDELNSSQQPVFIVGMPFSGQSLVEQLLTHVTDCFPAGDLSLIDELIDNLNLISSKEFKRPGLDGNYTSNALRNKARYYINHVNNMAIKKGICKPSLISNSMANNFLHLGLISLMFPNARIIHCKRNRQEVILSCYFHNFENGNEFSYDMKNITLYHDQYERIMDHWDDVLPNKMHTIDYAELVRNPQTVVKNLYTKFGINIEKQKASAFSLKLDQELIYKQAQYEQYFDFVK